MAARKKSAYAMKVERARQQQRDLSKGEVPRIARSVGVTKPHPELREAAAATAKALEIERWDAGDGGIIAQDILAALRAQGNAHLRAHEDGGGNNRWIGGVFKTKKGQPRYWQQSTETRSASDMARNTGSALRAVWYRADRDLAEALRRHGRGAGPVPVPSVMPRPTEVEMRKTIESLRVSVKVAQFQGHVGADLEEVRKTMNWIAGQCSGDRWWTS